MQTSMNVRVMTPMTVMRMHSALTQREALPVLASLATLEMVSTVQVRHTFNSCECMGVNMEALHLHAVYKKPYFVLQVT